MTRTEKESAREPEVCAHRYCSCELHADRVESAGKSYCSEGCAAGYGCDHADCLCGSAPDR